jgi:hypothetical protein
MYTAEPLLLEFSSFEVEITAQKLKIYKSPGIYQIPIESIQALSNILRSEIHKFINAIWNKEGS